MTPDQMSAGTHDCGGDAAAYVLGALDPEEVEAFRRHMDGCVVCRDEVTSLQQTVDALPMSAPQLEVPRGVRRRVLADVRDDAAAKRAAAAAGSRRQRWNIPRPAVAIGAVAALALAVFGGAELASNRAGPDRIYGSIVGHGQLHVDGGHAQLVVRNLRYLPAGRTYEVWLQRGTGKPSPAHALFTVTKVGDGHVDVPGSLNGVTAVMVTNEPASGSPAPTTKPVIVTKLD